MDYQWYPGHMTKAVRMMRENMKLIDLVIEIIDARVPLSSRNPDIDDLAKGKARLLVLTKADMADQKRTDAFVRCFEKNGFTVVSLDARERQAADKVRKAVVKACAEKIARDEKKGLISRSVRAMVVGIPNVGKSTLINSISGRKSAKTGNKPGVTRGKQWISVKLTDTRQTKGGSLSLDLLDTPGILWPKFEDKAVGEKLALLGSIRDEILDQEELALALLSFLSHDYPSLLFGKYAKEGDDRAIFTDLEGQEALIACLVRIGQNRGHLQKGGETDTARTAGLLLDDFRNGKIGRISMDRLPEEEKAETKEETTSTTQHPKGTGLESGIRPVSKA